MNTLVIGGAGFIGSHLVDSLISAGHSVHVVDNLFLGRRENLTNAFRADPSLRLTEADWSDPERAFRIVSDASYDLLVDLATIPLPASLVKPLESVMEITKLALSSCEVVRTGRATRLLYVSSSEVYGTALSEYMDEDHPLNPETPYAAAKMGAEKIVDSYRRTFGIDAKVVRPFNNYGPRQNDREYAGLIPICLTRMQNGEDFEVFGDGLQSRDFIYVKDTANAIRAIAEEWPGSLDVVNVATGIETTVLAVMRHLVELNAGETRIVHRPARPGDVRRHCGRSLVLEQSLAAELTKTSLPDGLLETYAWHRGLRDLAE